MLDIGSRHEEVATERSGHGEGLEAERQARRVESWHEEVDEHAIEFVTFKQDIDSTPMLKGLPNDQCHCPHWGYVLKGRVTFTVDGQEEVMESGDAFYIPPGHLQRAEAGTEYLQFSPAKEMSEVEQQVMKNLQEMRGA